MPRCSSAHLSPIFGGKEGSTPQPSASKREHSAGLFAAKESVHQGWACGNKAAGALFLLTGAANAGLVCIPPWRFLRQRLSAVIKVWNTMGFAYEYQTTLLSYELHVYQHREDDRNPHHMQGK
jgi:hypothetical protein